MLIDDMNNTISNTSDIRALTTLEVYWEIQKASSCLASKRDSQRIQKGIQCHKSFPAPQIRPFSLTLKKWVWRIRRYEFIEQSIKRTVKWSCYWRKERVWTIATTWLPLWLSMSPLTNGGIKYRQASNTQTTLRNQFSTLRSSQSKMGDMMEKLPLIGNLIKNIRNKRNKDKYIDNYIVLYLVQSYRLWLHYYCVS